MPLRGPRRFGFLDDLPDGCGGALDRGGEWIAAKRPEPDQAHFRRFPRTEREPVVVHHDPLPGASYNRPRSGEVQTHDGDVLGGDISPDVGLRPVGKRKDTDRLAGMDAGVVQAPQLGPLRLRVPLVPGSAKGEDPLLGARLFLIPPRPAQDDVISAAVQRLFQRFGFHHGGVSLGVVGERTYSFGQPRLIDMDNELHPGFGRDPVAERDHLAELPRRVDVQERKGGQPGPKCLAGQVQHDGGILADRIQHDRPIRQCDRFPDYFNGFRFKVRNITVH